MAAPLEEVIAFVRTSSIKGERKLDVAIVFAESMLRELQATVDEWDRTARALRGERAVRQGTPARDGSHALHEGEGVACCKLTT
jgi:hypothetical protein